MTAVVAMPIWTAVSGPTTACLAALMAATPCPFLTTETTYLHLARLQLLHRALAAGATHVLFLDADMTFPADTLTRLRAWAAPVVGANYRRRRPPHAFTAMNSDEAVSSVGRTGIEAVDTLGFGVVLIDLAALRDVPPPWFGTGLDGEDVAFCRQARAAGLPILVDHDLSQQVGHVTTYTLTPDSVT